MTAYYILMLLIFGLGYPMCIYKPDKKKTIIYVCIVFVYMFFMSTLRYGIGYDYYNYMRPFYDMTDNHLTIAQVHDTYSFEYGYILIMKLAELMGGDYIILLGLCSLLTLAPAAYIICRYSKMPSLSCWLYLAITFFYNCMNFTRQSIGAAIILLCWRFFKERKHLGVLGAVIIASMFHTSMLVMLPVYIFSLIKPSKRLYGIVGGCGILVYIFSEHILEFAVTKLAPSYEKYLDSRFLTVGLSPVFLIVPFIIAAIIIPAYFFGNKTREGAFAASLIFCNFFIWIFITKHYIIERFSLPVYIFTLITLPDALCFWKEYFAKMKEKLSEKGEVKNLYFKKGQLKKIANNGFAAMMCITVGSTFLYNVYCSKEGVHGVFPYTSVIYPDGGADTMALETNPRSVYVNSTLTKMLSLANRRSSTVVICSAGNTGGYIGLVDRIMLRSLGFDTDLDSLGDKRFMGISVNGRAKLEEVSNEDISTALSFFSGKYNISLSSTSEGASINVNGREFAPDGAGLMFAVFDNELQIITTSQGYDTASRGCPYIHSDAFTNIWAFEGFEDLTDYFSW